MADAVLQKRKDRNRLESTNAIAHVSYTWSGDGRGFHHRTDESAAQTRNRDESNSANSMGATRAQLLTKCEEGYLQTQIRECGGNARGTPHSKTMPGRALVLI